MRSKALLSSGIAVWTLGFGIVPLVFAGSEGSDQRDGNTNVSGSSGGFLDYLNEAQFKEKQGIELIRVDRDTRVDIAGSGQSDVALRMNL